jgi:hypothetical protein
MIIPGHMWIQFILSGSHTLSFIQIVTGAPRRRPCQSAPDDPTIPLIYDVIPPKRIQITQFGRSPSPIPARGRSVAGPMRGLPE